MGMLFAAGFGSADKSALLAEDRRKPGARVANRNADTHRHKNGKGEHSGFPAGIAGAALGDKIKSGRSNGG